MAGAEWLARLWDDWLPPRCPGCGSQGEAWCRGCRPTGPAGVVPLAAGVPLAYRARYRGRWAAVLRAWKLGRRHDLTEPLAIEAGVALAALPLAVADRVLLLPVPPRTATLRHRGVDLVGGLVAALARGDSSVDALSGLRWDRQPAEQVGAGRAARWANVAGALRADPAVAGRSVVVCDDIATTGSTLAAAAAAAGEAGGRVVAALALGRTGRGDPAAPGGPAEG